MTIETQAPPKFITDNFYGTVILKDWMRALDDRQIMRLTGIISIVQDEQAVGFKTRGNESNWLAHIAGDSEEWNILGCQIRAIIAHSPDAKQTIESAYVVR